MKNNIHEKKIDREIQMQPTPPDASFYGFRKRLMNFKVISIFQKKSLRKNFMNLKNVSKLKIFTISKKYEVFEKASLISKYVPNFKNKSLIQKKIKIVNGF